MLVESDLPHIGVIAEFVETAAIVTELCKLNVDFGQDYYFGNPESMPEALSDASA